MSHVEQVARMLIGTLVPVSPFLRHILLHVIFTLFVKRFVRQVAKFSVHIVIVGLT